MKEYNGTCTNCNDAFTIKDFNTLKNRNEIHGFDLCPRCLKSKLRKKNDYDIEYTCTCCGNKFKVKRSAFNNRKSSGVGFDKCLKCLRKESRDNWSDERKLNDSKIHSKLMKQQMANMTESEKLKFSEMRSQLAILQWNSMTYGDRENMITKMKEGWKNVDDELKIKYSIERSKHMKEYYTNMTEKERENRSKMLKNIWANRSNEIRDYIIQSLIGGRNKWWNELSSDDKKSLNDARYNYLKEYHDNMSDSDRVDYYNRIAETNKIIWSNKSVDELIEHGKKSKSKWNTMSKSDKQLKIDLLQNGYLNWWNNMTDDEYNKWAYDHAVGLSKSASSRGPTELYFSNDLLTHSITYEWGYVNQIIHDDFNKLFTVNPITNGKVSPYHAWDFKVGNILIDIDGSEHSIQPNEFITKDGIDVGGLVQFNDSQRPYQTDGLDAYIVMAYNNTITDDTPVYSIHENIYIFYYDLINILKYYNGKGYK